MPARRLAPQRRRAGTDRRGELTIGRAEDNDLSIARRAGLAAPRPDLRRATVAGGSPTSARATARCSTASACGEDARPLENGDAIEIGDRELRFLSGEETRMASREVPVDRDADGRLRRRAAADRPRPAQRRRACRTRTSPASTRRSPPPTAAIELRDLGSQQRHAARTASWSARGSIEPGSAIGIGPVPARLRRRGLPRPRRARRDAPRRRGRHACRPARRRSSAGLGVARPGELVAVIGESGAGKSTLLKAPGRRQPALLAGASPSTASRSPPA